MVAMVFDFVAFKRACETKDADAWIEYFAQDAEWVEYRHQDPPQRPHRMAGRDEIETFLRQVAIWPITLTIEDELIDADRAAFRTWVGLADGKRIVEHVMLYLDEDKIRRQVDVEAWD